MKKILKRVIAVILCVALMTGVFSACSSFNLNANDNYISKSKWVELLGKTFGLGNDEETVTENVNYVQLCNNWDMLPKNDKVKNSDKINREYALATSVFALGDDLTGLSRDITSNKKAAAYAVDQKIGDSKSWIYMHEGLTENEAVKILIKTSNAYNNREFETYDRNKYKSDLKRQEDTTDYRINSADNEVIVDSNINKYNVGDTVIFGTGVDARALKITGSTTSGNETILSTEQAEITDVCDSVDVSGTGTVESADDIQTADGVKLASFNGQSLADVNEKPTIENLGRSNGTDFENVKKHDLGGSYKTSDLGFEVSKSDGKISANPKIGKLKLGAENGFTKKDSDGKELLGTDGKPIPNDQIEKISKTDEYGMTKEYSEKSGFKITGSFNIDNISVGANIKLNTIDIGKFDTGEINPFKPADSFDIKINADITNELSLEGYLNREISVATFPIPVGPIAITVKVKIYSDTNGKIGIKIVTNNKTSVTWKSGKGLKRVNHTETNKDFSLEASIEMGPKLELGLGISGTKELIDVNGSFGINIKAKLEANSMVLGDEGLFLHGGDEDLLTNRKDVYLICTDFTEFMPVVKIGVNTGSSVLAKLSKKLKNAKLSAEWEIVGTDDTDKNWAGKFFHYEANKGFVDECTKDSLDVYQKDSSEENVEEKSKDLINNNDDETTESSENDYLGLQIDTYAVNVDVGNSETIGITSLPKDCTADDITVESSDTSVATVGDVNSDNNTGSVSVTGVSEGTATVTVTCNKTGESLACTIIVTE